MKPKDLAELTLLAAIWGASFLFIRLAAAEFGAAPLMLVRVGGASLLLLPILAWRGEAAALLGNWRQLLVVGLCNSALPFYLYAWAAVWLSAGFEAVINASTPLWTSVVAYAWLGQRLPRLQAAGLLLGFVGVAVLVWGKVSLAAGGDGLAVLAAMAAPIAYGIAANYTRQYLPQRSPLLVATGSQLGATLILLPLACWQWPARLPSSTAWIAALLLASLCTALAYLLFFRLLSRNGPSKAVSVTFLIPVFAIVWGNLFLGEVLSMRMALGGIIIVLGTVLALGLWPRPRAAAAVA